MMVARMSRAECAASDTSASEPEKSPTTALAIVSAPDAAIEVSATRSFWSCIDPPSGGARCGNLRGRFAHRFVILTDQTRAKLGGCGNIVDAADALAGRPDVLPGALFVVQIELLGGRRQVDVRGSGRVDTRP